MEEEGLAQGISSGEGGWFPAALCALRRGRDYGGAGQALGFCRWLPQEQEGDHHPLEPAPSTESRGQMMEGGLSQPEVTASSWPPRHGAGLHHGMLQAPTPCWDPKLQSVWEKLSTEGTGGKVRGSLAAPGHQFLWSWPNQAPRRAAEAHFILLVQGGGHRFRALYKYSPQHLRQRRKRAVASLIRFQNFPFP